MKPALPTDRATTRADYRRARKHVRNHLTMRVDRDLPPHPAGSGWAQCPACDGAGEHIVNNTNPHGYGPDPQHDEPVECGACLGTGEVPDGRGPDPLAVMRTMRYNARILRSYRRKYRAAVAALKGD